MAGLGLAEAPNKFHQVITIGAVTFEAAFDGIHGWTKARSQLREFVGTELTDIIARADSSAS